MSPPPCLQVMKEERLKEVEEQQTCGNDRREGFTVSWRGARVR